ncbi:thioredoxin family protein [Pseudomonas petrae]|uniref:Thioredoxin family protein n=1 Tax=Pseudomonas petrae TaxID=2912190 RepID=A0ABS9I447_9PSED|nr:thioredoxin domain-containing protein [Pseudomonas petrae]MCF7531861.1 thioredoxin family protein [Pseudomonas petrae]MCF7537424.1 thioredoxin family protein [Pseudomonas petrae]MCF7542580.1 thioredoxin family protein [Pseudomonas petrae]MCF7556819.1 thioredoxin family protein [Pseudomonas petrae]
MEVMTLTDENFDNDVWLSPSVDKGGALSVVLFTNGVKATGEQPKKASEKASDLLAELATDYNDKVGLSFFEVDYRSNPQIATRFDIQSAPTFLFLQIEEVVGGNTKEWLKAKIDKKIG